MPHRLAIPSLLPVPRFTAPEDEAHLPHARRIFALRDLHFRDVKALGFDMDYTLSHYRSPEIDELAFRKAARLLVQEKGYPGWMLDEHFDPGFAVRGLVLDGVRGNLLKLDRERQVVRATHGTRPMAREAIDTCYGRRRLGASAKGFRSVDTLFEIPESHFYAMLVDNLDRGRLPGKSYLGLFQDLRWAIDTAHRNGDIKTEVLADRDFYILRDPELPIALDRWKRAGKRLFVVSNSDWTFTNGVLGYLLDGQDPARPRWQDYFDLVVVSARKPAFFEERNAPEPLESPNAFQGGNAMWLEEHLGVFGEEILYVGDHIYGDILRSKKTVSWHTLLLIPELADILERLEQQAEGMQELLRAEHARRQLEAHLALLRDRLHRNREHHRTLASRLSPEALRALDREATQIRDGIDLTEASLAAQETLVQERSQEVAGAFNPLWGSLFREGYEQTRFADQIQRYACAYTGRISNLYLMDPMAAIYAPVPTLPHERM